VQALRGSDLLQQCRATQNNRWTGVNILRQAEGRSVLPYRQRDATV